jgi:pimeloyl-ACP methyl ester carboxylesterase
MRAISRQRRSIPSVVLVHGAGGTHLDWPAELRRLPGAAVLVPDLPGHGRSSLPGRRDVADYAADLARFLAQVEPEPVIVIGHSMGGAIAQILALHYPQLISGLVLIGTSPRLKVHPTIIEQVLTQPEQVFAQFADWIWAETVPQAIRGQGIKRMAALDPVVVQGDYVACDAFDSRGQLAGIAVPTLVIGSTADQMTPLKFSITLAEEIPNAERYTVEGSGHMIQLERPQQVADAITKWLARYFKKEQDNRDA